MRVSALLLAAASSPHHKHATDHSATTKSLNNVEAVPDPAHFFKMAALAVNGFVAVLLLGGLLGYLIHRAGRYCPEVAVAGYALIAVPSAMLVGRIIGHPTATLVGVGALLTSALAIGLRLDHADSRAGNDRRRRAEQRLSFLGLARAALTERRIATAAPAADEVIIGRTRTRIVKLKRGWESGRHTGVLGAPGSGKSTTIAALLQQHVEGVGGRRHGAVIIDPKGDPTIASAAARAAKAANAPLLVFSPEGGLVYDVLAGGDVDRRTDKILAAEDWTEPHYLAGATTYLREVMRTMETLRVHPTLSKVLTLMDPDRHEAIAAKAGPEYAKQLGSYLSGLTPRQRNDLAGLRDRIAALGRSDMAVWLDPDRNAQAPRLNLGAAVQSGAVVLFQLQADDYPMLSKKVAAAIVLDLIAVAQRHQNQPVPTYVAIDEFGAIESDLVLRLLARARAAGFSVTLAAQTVADFDAAAPSQAMATRVVGNLNALIVGRLNDASEAEWIAQTAGTKDSWTTTQRTNLLLPASEGTRTLNRDFRIHPDHIKTLARGQAAVIALDPIPGQQRVEITDIRPPHRS
jgi:hypothetical protein